MASITDCGMANLLGAILSKDSDLIKIRLGIPLPAKRICFHCDKPIVNTNRYFCNAQCQHNYSFIQVECPECGILFRRYQSSIKYHLNHILPSGKPQTHFFCSRKCMGKFSARTNGGKMKLLKPKQNRVQIRVAEVDYAGQRYQVKRGKSKSFSIYDTTLEEVWEIVKQSLISKAEQ